jgi:hypothetical protein
MRPKKAPDMSSITPIKVMSKIYFNPFDILFIINEEIKNVIIIDTKPNNNFSEFGRKFNKILETI